MSDPRGGSPRAFGGVFDSFEGYTALFYGTAPGLPFLKKAFCSGRELPTLIGRPYLFDAGIVTHCRWSERYRPRCVPIG